MKKQTLELIDDKTQRVEAYHEVQSVVEEFAQFAGCISKTLLLVTQEIYHKLDLAGHYTLNAGNTYDVEEKIQLLEQASFELFSLFSSLELLVKAKGTTVGQMNNVLVKAKIAYTSVNKWLTQSRKAAG